jgi:phosphomannomutase
MSLIKSISGIRGTIGGKPGNTLSPIDLVKFTAAYATWIKNRTTNNRIVIGRDGRMSGKMVEGIVINTLISMGLDVINCGLSTTPTIEMAVVFEQAAGGIILTASHNPKEWNALKLLNEKGEFISAADGANLLLIAESENFEFVSVDSLGAYIENTDSLSKHIQAVVNHELVDVEKIKSKNFKIVVDAINSSGAIALPELFKAIGVKDYTILNNEMHGNFAHNPEPLAQHLTELCSEVVKQNAYVGIAVDPDVDRLCFVCEDGILFGEEYTLVSIADYFMQNRKGNTVSNMSSTRALKDVTLLYGGSYFPSAVGEVNVVNKMKEVNAVIGGEGNGGIIVPDLHYGRDALIGIALFLTYLAQKNITVSQLRKTYPEYFMSKNKIDLKEGIQIENIFKSIQEKYKMEQMNTEDGLKIDFANGWVHLRTSNTEPIIRVYSESKTEEMAHNLAQQIMKDIQELF